MKAYATEAIRNLAVIGHGDAGKTQLISSLLHVAGATPRWGKVDEGTTVTDHDEDSIARKITLNTALAHLEHREIKVNLIDTPGYAAFVSHARPACRVADCGIVVVDGVKGVEVQTEKAWGYANEFMLPRMMVVTKLDKEHSDIGIALDSAHNIFKRAIVPFTLPIGKEHNFKGVVDVVHLKAYQFDENGKAKEIDIPAEGRDVVDKTRERLVELVAASDDALMEKYFDQGTLDDADVIPNIGKAIAASKLCPVYSVSTTTLVGLSTLRPTRVVVETANTGQSLLLAIALPMLGNTSESSRVPWSKYFSIKASSDSATSSTSRSRVLSTTSRPSAGMSISLALPFSSNW